MLRLSAPEIAQLCGVNRATALRWQKGRGRVPAAALKLITMRVQGALPEDGQALREQDRTRRQHAHRMRHSHQMKRGQPFGLTPCSELVGGARFELATNGLKVVDVKRDCC